MKQFLAALFIVALSTSVYAVETKKECITVKDAKTGKEKQQCKVMKVHKKLEGTAIPTKK